MADETGKDDGAKQGMVDDISSELRDWAFIVDETIGKAHVVMLSGLVFSKAADEIERLRADLAEAKVVLSQVRTGKLLLALEEEQSLSEQMFQAIDGLVNPITDPNGYHPYLERFRKAHVTYKEFRETRPLIAQTVESVR